MLSCNAETGEKSSLRGVGNAGESALEIDNNSVALDGQRRRLFSFWSIVMEGASCHFYILTIAL